MKPLLRFVTFAVSGLWLCAAVPGAAFPGAAPSRVEQTPSRPAGPAPGAPQPSVLTPEKRGDILMARKNYADAADYYYRALKEGSFKDAMLWNKLGIAYQQQNKFRVAHQAYVRATRLDRNFAEGWNNIGTVYFMEKKYRKSKYYYERAIRLKTDIAAFHMNLGTTYYHLKKFDDAVEQFRTALTLDPNVVIRESATGTVIDAGEGDVQFYFYMAKAFASVGDAEKAVRYLRRALEDGFSDPKRVTDDPDFKKISQDPAFVELMRNPPTVLKN